MVIRNVGNNQGVDGNFNDLQNEQIKESQPINPSTPAAAETVGSAISSNTQLEKSLRARRTLSSQRVKAALDSRLQGGAPGRAAVGREFQPAIANILRSASRLNEGTAKYRAHTEAQLNSIKGDARQFLNHAQSSRQRLEQGRDTLAAASQPQELIGVLENLIKLVQDMISQVQGHTNDLLANTNRNLGEMTKGAANFEGAANQMAAGNAFALKPATKALQQVGDIPQKISAQANNYANNIKQAVEPVATQAKSAAAVLDTSSHPEAFSLKDIAHGLADSAYQFYYNVKEKAGSIIDEYVNPILKAISTGVINLWNSIFHPDKNPIGKSIPPNQLVSNTQDLRDTIKAAQSGDPNAVTKLQQKYGYTPATAPKPGQMWVAANYTLGELENGLVTAKHFPGNTSTTTLNTKPVDTNPPNVSKFLFGEAGRTVNNPNPTPTRSITLVDENGNQTTVHSTKEYQALVAANRAKLGMPVNNGNLIPVQLSLEGGGGKGKRFAPAFEQMYNLGIVPTSVSGVSVGAIAGSLIAAGLDPRKADEISKDPATKKFFDASLGEPGLLEGRELYRFMDQKLRELTGIKDRPVTFADLPMPLYLGTTKFADSQATTDGTHVADRTFIFSKETTPDTPVAMAAVASAAIPGAFDPVDMVDVATGRTVRLYDGGVVKQLPIGYQHLNPNNHLPEVAIQLNEPNQNNPKAGENNETVQPLPPGNLISDNPFGNAKLGLDVQAKSAATTRDYQDRINPKPGVFVLNVPTWNLQNFSQQDSTFGFEYDNKIDPALDKQTADVTNDFFRQFLGKLSDPKASGTNLNPFPPDTAFTSNFTVNGANWMATHATGSDEVTFVSNTGETHHINLGESRLENWIADNVSFGDLANRMRDVLVDHEKFLSTFGL